MKYSDLALILLLIVIAPAAASAEYSYGSIDGKNESCLVCHQKAETVGERYRVDAMEYNHTSHARIGCVACHDTMSSGHPADGITSQRSACSQCHADTTREYAQSSHAGKAACGNCHNPHRVKNAQEVSGQQMNRMCAG